MQTYAEFLLWNKVNEWTDEDWIFNGFNQKKFLIEIITKYAGEASPKKNIKHYKSKFINYLYITMNYYNSSGNGFIPVNKIYYDIVDEIDEIDIYKYAFQLDNVLIELKKYFIIKIHDKARELAPWYFT
jgi:hypothetical protein